MVPMHMLMAFDAQAPFLKKNPGTSATLGNGNGIPLHTKRLPNKFQNNFGSASPPPKLPNRIAKPIR